MYIVVSFDWLLVPHLVQKGLFRILYVWIQGSIKCEFATVMRDFDKNLDFVYFKIKIDIVFKPTIWLEMKKISFYFRLKNLQSFISNLLLE